MVIRTYIDKDNTIIKDSYVNTGLNPIAELFHGGSDLTYSRHLFYFDVEDLKSRYNCGELVDLSNVKHTLKMTNTSLFDDSLLGGKTCDGKVRSCSFDLILFEVNQPWDEGCGYDYACHLYLPNDSTQEHLQEGASNWYNATSLSAWTEAGVYSGSPSGITITTQHFDKGNENLEMDITDVVNDLITGNTPNYGYGIAYNYTLEQMFGDDVKYVGFFTKQTDTYYEPFVETIHNNPILDDRGKFYKGKTNKLYLYVNVGGEPVCLDNNPFVTLYDETDCVFSALTSADTQLVTSGVYCAEFDIPFTANDCVLYTDVWSGLTYNGIALSNVSMTVEVKSDEEYYQIGSETLTLENYGFSISGVKRDEKIKRGDQRKINVRANKPYTYNQIDVIDGLEYRLYVKEGPAEVTVIDWQPVNRAFDNNYFILDTSWMIPNTYYLDIKISSRNEVKHLTDVMKFIVTNQVIL
jgi:hypothetical protein